MCNARVSGIARRCKAYGLPAQWASELASDIKKWETNSGPAWTVSRLKSLKNDFVRMKAGLPSLTWVRKNRDGEWFGVWGSLKRFSQRGEQQFRTVVNCLMAYSAYKPEEPTPAHVAKFRASVEAPRVYLPPRLLQDVSEHATKMYGKLNLGPSQALVTYQGCPSVKSPTWLGRSVPQNEQLEKEVDWISHPPHKKFLNRHYAAYEPVLEGLDSTLVYGKLAGLSGGIYHLGEMGPFETVDRFIRPPQDPKTVLAGNVVPLTKDGGWKVRWIASPFRIHQLALAPLGSGLFSLLRELPWDCTFDQTKGVPAIQDHLSKGKMAFAVDLTSATDFFPLDLQVAILRKLLPHGSHYVDLFAELSRCTWSTQKWGNVSWTQGQPMGLYPSFPSFALAHGTLLHLLSGGVPNSFFVLGDDVVILDHSLHDRYQQVLQLLGCPTDPVKSIASSQLTEFAGKIIFPGSVCSPFKWREVNQDNFLDMMGQFGSRFSCMLTRREKDVWRTIGHLLPPYGVSHSIPGVCDNFSDAYRATLEFEEGLEENSIRRYETSFLGKLVRLLDPRRPKSLFHAVDWKWARRKAQDLDERTQSAFDSTPLRSVPGNRTPLTDVLEFSGVTPELPAVGPKNLASQPSTLERYEKIIRVKGLRPIRPS